MAKKQEKNSTNDLSKIGDIIPEKKKQEENQQQADANRENMQTGATQEDHPHNKYAETLLILDTQSGRLEVASEIDPAAGLAKVTDPELKNQGAFFKVTEPNILGNFISNFCARFQNTSWSFFVAPFNAVPALVEASRQYLADKNNTDARNKLREHRVTTQSLEKIVFSKSELPWTELSRFISREDAEKDTALMKAMTEGLPIERLFPIEHKLDENTSLKGQVGIELYRDKDRQVKMNLVTPLSQPQYLEPHYAAQLSADDVKQAAEGGTIKKLLISEQGNMCYACINSATNRWHLKDKNEVTIPNFINGKGLTDIQKSEAAYGREIFMENCKVYGQDNTFSGKVSYDIKQNGFVTRDAVYARPNVPDHIRAQLTGAQYTDLMNYQEINAGNIKKRDGISSYKVLHIDPRTNNLAYWPKRNQGFAQGQPQQAQPQQAQPQQGGQNFYPQAQGHQPGQSPFDPAPAQQPPAQDIPDFMQNEQAYGRGRGI